MATFAIRISDLKTKDDRLGVQIHFENSHPAKLMLNGEPAGTAAQLVGLALVEEAKRMCDDLGLTYEEKV